MDVSTHLDHLVADGARLAAAAAAAGWDAEVAACDWTVRDLVCHVGGVHRWATEVVATGAPGPDVAAVQHVGRGPGDEALLAWFRDGHAALVDTLRAAPADLECFSFLPAPSPLAFWARRQAHETAVHRADAESAAGTITPFDRDLAQDGIAEMLQGFASRKSQAIARTGVLVLHPSDGGSAWRISIGGERTVAAPVDDGPPGGDATVRGSSSALYLWLWNRPAEVTVEGDDAVAKAWADVRIQWG